MNLSPNQRGDTLTSAARHLRTLAQDIAATADRLEGRAPHTTAALAVLLIDAQAHAVRLGGAASERIGALLNNMVHELTEGR